MHLTLEADYAVRIVDKLAIENKKIDAHTISEQTNVPLRFALKILRKLVASGAVKSYKGAHGGYMIAKDPKDITLREVIEAVEGPFMISRCQQDDYCCTIPPAVCIIFMQKSHYMVTQINWILIILLTLKALEDYLVTMINTNNIFLA